jgi:putative DNA primase/helicase
VRATHQLTRAPLRPENIPDELKMRPQWVVWRYEERDGKETKVPYCATSPDVKASTTDLMTWGTFGEALVACNRGDADGVGFMFSSVDPYAGVDLDGCRDPESGHVEEWAVRMIDRLRGYAEISPSGEGAHVIVKGRLPEGVKHKIELENGGGIEAYSERRFFTMTGRKLQ